MSRVAPSDEFTHSPSMNIWWLSAMFPSFDRTGVLLDHGNRGQTPSMPASGAQRTTRRNARRAEPSLAEMDNAGPTTNDPERPRYGSIWAASRSRARSASQNSIRSKLLDRSRPVSSSTLRIR